MSENRRVVVHGSLAPQCLEYLREHGLHVDEAPHGDERELIARVAACHALIVDETSGVDAGVLSAAALLQVVGRIMRPSASKQARVVDYLDLHVPVLRRSAASRLEIFSRW